MQWRGGTYEKAGEGTDGNDEESTKVRIGEEGPEDGEAIRHGGPSGHHFCTFHNAHSVTIHQVHYHVRHDSVARHLLQTLVHWSLHNQGNQNHAIYISNSEHRRKSKRVQNITYDERHGSQTTLPLFGFRRRTTSIFQDILVRRTTRVHFFPFLFGALNLRGSDAKTWMETEKS